MDNAVWINHVRSEQHNKLSRIFFFFLLNELHNFIHKNKNYAHENDNERRRTPFAFEKLNGISHPINIRGGNEGTWWNIGGWWKGRTNFTLTLTQSA